MATLGKILTVDLTARRTRIEDYDASIIRQVLAGRGFNSLLLPRQYPWDSSPLDAESPLLLSGGLLTGTEAPSSSRLHVSARSPLTGLMGSSSMGGHFGSHLRTAGFQGIILHGRSESPLYLAVTDGTVELQDASDLWGLDAWEAQATLRGRHGEGSRAMAIGPGGERLVRYACIMTERGHAAGRTGMGAVMGSKGLKAIVIQGGASQPSTDVRIRDAVRRYAMAIRSAPRYPIYSKYSNTGFVTWADETGILATRNYRENRFEGAGRIDGMRMIDYVTRPTSCYRCAVHCKAEVRIDEGPYAGLEGERPDIEPIVALGSKCGVDDVEAVLHLYNLCGRLGIDAISAGSSLAFAMELLDQGIVSDSETDGIGLTWGNAPAMDAMLRKIAAREGFGAILAEGVAGAARTIGRGAERYAYHSKGLELTAYDPRGAMGTALGYAVSNRGADFTSIYALPEYRWDREKSLQEFGDPLATDQRSIEGKALVVKRTMAVSAAIDALGLCKVAALNVTDDFSLRGEAELASAIAGIDFTPEELVTIGERILNLERLFNLRGGAARADDTLPAHFLSDGLSQQPGQGATVELEPMVSQFYAAMGWDDEGRPTEATLRGLGIL